ncbi:NnrU family protein [Paracoccus aerodenitrificans]|uniref:NnrU family protein n=1 Tax=Paracoccus aerodenitrificans TaxID=3017781 RepID=UPI0022F0E999|nr:NnrU family protein [Paracoccus aerodenitrificans]WBU63097.1 NnrU family protein [Paracoccus aerodenitrificans]
MLILILGVALWWAAHLFKRVTPEARANLGERGPAVVTGLLVLSVLLMIWGYRIAPADSFWWGPSPMMKGINNLLVLIAVYLFAAAGMKTGITKRLRHPQLTGFALWAFAHLLVNGDLPSLVLFGGLLAWAIAEMVIINRAEPGWTAPAHSVPLRKEVMALAGTLIVYGVAGLVHGWLGYNPFGA